jgi:hypothetical protein
MVCQGRPGRAFRNARLATGLVNSLSHPGGNTTGLTILSPELSAKRLAVLREMVPRNGLRSQRLVFLIRRPSVDRPAQFSGKPDARHRVLPGSRPPTPFSYYRY